MFVNLPSEVRSSVNTFKYSAETTEDGSLSGSSILPNVCSGFVDFPSILHTKEHENILNTNISNVTIGKHSRYVLRCSAGTHQAFLARA